MRAISHLFSTEVKNILHLGNKKGLTRLKANLSKKI